ncbi:Ycf51 family protein [Leptolyngbya sp. FACHB-261]|uniref:Ycf51 family protein n=1 Tax=Leptolyngbya sp. FACHB-261 TaxID=2692806 RepID=UPI0016894904|nr:Ycf51 family protein [Leptolyngbya sp. FACHB-261]MBD2101467.1 Ycf51 family protein [Leptolyngbya sp. FACHB-261]
MLTTANFLTYAQYMGLFTIACALVTVIAFVTSRGWRFRLVGVTGFSIVLTVGLFALSLVPFTRTVVPGAVRYAVVFDNGGPNVVITVPATINQDELQATLQQAALNLYTPGRVERDRLWVRARALLHPQPGVSQPVFLGEARYTPELNVEIFPDQLTLLQG